MTSCAEQKGANAFDFTPPDGGSSVITPGDDGGAANPSIQPDAEGPPASTFPVDCRDGNNNANPACSGPVGSGPSLKRLGNQILSGYDDKGSDSFYVSGSRTIMKVARATGARTMVMGTYDDPALGLQTVGTGVSWPEQSLIAIRPKKDGKIFAMASDGFYVIDPTDGNRTKYRDRNASPNRVRDEGLFAVDPANTVPSSHSRAPWTKIGTREPVSRTTLQGTPRSRSTTAPSTC